MRVISSCINQKFPISIVLLGALGVAKPGVAITIKAQQSNHPVHITLGFKAYDASESPSDINVPATTDPNDHGLTCTIQAGSESCTFNNASVQNLLHTVIAQAQASKKGYVQMNVKSDPSYHAYGSGWFDLGPAVALARADSLLGTKWYWTGKSYQDAEM